MYLVNVSNWRVARRASLCLIHCALRRYESVTLRRWPGKANATNIEIGRVHLEFAESVERRSHDLGKHQHQLRQQHCQYGDAHLRHHATPCKDIRLQLRPIMHFILHNGIQQRIEMEIHSSIIILDELVEATRQVYTLPLRFAWSIEEGRVIVTKTSAVQRIWLVLVVKREDGDFSGTLDGSALA